MNGAHYKADKMTWRFEKFGGIVSSTDPAFLAFVDRDYMRNLGVTESPLWEGEDESVGLLSAPTEVHFSITNRCSVQCGHCYMEGGAPDAEELDTAAMKRGLDVLAKMGVFHVALGGGEALERADLFEIAQYARDIGLVPNLTTSGVGLTVEMAAEMKVFGQVNVSIDGVGDSYGVFRAKDNFDVAANAIGMLVEADVSTGINCVVGRRNFDKLAEVFAFARDKGINEIEFLRFKPSGRGKENFLAERTTHEQNIALLPMLAKMGKEYGITARIDCSFVPMLCWHRPETEVLEVMATYGCEAGNVLLGVRSDGTVSGCSFMAETGLSIFDLYEPSVREEHFREFFNWAENADEPCRSCEYLKICKGGCHGVAEFVTGSIQSADPDCPFVVEYEREKKQS